MRPYRPVEALALRVVSLGRTGLFPSLLIDLARRAGHSESEAQP